jgi:hypothetical protein
MWKMWKMWKKNKTITNLFIKQNVYEKINHLINNWSSNEKNNNINYEKLLLTIKNTKTRIIASNKQYENREKTLSLNK